MQIRSIRYIALFWAALMVIGLCLVDAGAQKRRRRHSVAPPVAAQSPNPDDPNSSDPKIVSTADQSSTGAAAKSNAKAKPGSTPAPESEQEALRRTITDLSGQVTKLSDKLNQMEEQQRSLVDLERLSRAEQRAESFRTQLQDVQSKELDLQGQLDQIEYALQPESIARVVGMFGTTHPEEAREQRRKQLEAQRAKLRAQYEQLEQTRVRLESAIATADTEIDLLRKRLDAANQSPTESSGATEPAPSASPRPTPPPRYPEAPPPTN